MYILFSSHSGTMLLETHEVPLGEKPEGTDAVWGYNSRRPAQPRGPPALVRIRTASLLQRDRHHISSSPWMRRATDPSRDWSDDRPVCKTRRLMRRSRSPSGLAS